MDAIENGPQQDPAGAAGPGQHVHLRSGMLAGLAGGVAMGLVGLVITYWPGSNVGAWVPVKTVAGMFFPAEVVMRPGFDAAPVITGMLIHMVMAAVLGVVFAWLYDRLLKLPYSLGIPLLAGAAYGVLLWSLTFLFLPMVDPVLASTERPAFLLAHVAYGVVVGVVLQFLVVGENPEHALEGVE